MSQENKKEDQYDLVASFLYCLLSSSLMMFSITSKDSCIALSSVCGVILVEVLVVHVSAVAGVGVSITGSSFFPIEQPAKTTKLNHINKTATLFIPNILSTNIKSCYSLYRFFLLMQVDYNDSRPFFEKVNRKYVTFLQFKRRICISTVVVFFIF